MTDVPPPPWLTRVDVLAWWQGFGWAGASLRYRESPVGPYAELLAATRDGLRFTVPFMAVDSPASRTAGRVIWALPKQLADFAMPHIEGEGWHVSVLARSYGPVLPLVGLLPVRQPGLTFLASFAGRARPADVSVTTDGDTPLRSGEFPGLVARGRLTVLPPRRS